MSKTKMAALRRPKGLATPNVPIDILLLGAAIFIGFLGAYHIYQTPWFYWNVVVGITFGVGVAFVALTRAWEPWLVALTWLAGYIVLGFLLVAPFEGASLGYLGRRLLGVVRAPITGWRDLLTLQIPLGTYHQVMATVFFIATGVATFAFLMAWRSTKKWAWAGAAPFVPLMFGILFGSSAPGYRLFGLSGEWTEWLLGISTLFMTFAWLAWRPMAVRSGARAELRDSRGQIIRGRWVVSRIVRVGLGTLMIVLAVAVSAIVAPRMLDDRTRDVLRTNVDPNLHLSAQVSPLSRLREYYGDDLYDEPLFTFESSSPVPRIRLATLTAYDGNVFHPSSEDQTFIRVPSRITETEVGAEIFDQPMSGDKKTASTVQGRKTASVEVTIAGYEGVWVPIAGALVSVDFEGSDSEALTDGFFYNQPALTGVEISEPGLQEEVRYITEVKDELLSADDVRSFQPVGSGSFDVEVPEPITKWVENQALGDDGNSLVTLIENLRERGYLSHGLLEEENSDAKWVKELEGYQFAPSRSGHTLDRLDRMFTKVLEQEDAAGEGAAKELLVSAIGDDEQFAVAAALIASHLGYESRVVLGFRGEPIPADPTLTHCQDGLCTGGDITAWVEVRDGATGRWAALDVTPQHEMNPAPKIQQQSDPKHHTPVTPETITTLPPPQAEPSTSDAQVQGEDAKESKNILESNVVRVVGIIVLSIFVLASPFLAVIGAKRIRTSRRRKAPLAEERIVGAWHEYVDKAIDSGLSREPGATRIETAAHWSGEDRSALALAEAANHVVFSPQVGLRYDSRPAWKQSRRASAGLVSDQTRLGRIRTELSLRSLFGRGSTVN